MSALRSRFAHRQTLTLLKRLAEDASRAARNAGEDEVHDLRVSIRRFSAALRLFGPELDAGAARKIRRKLRKVMDAAGVIRDNDIAAALLESAGVERGGPLFTGLARGRETARDELQRLVRRWADHSIAGRWSARLGL